VCRLLTFTVIIGTAGCGLFMPTSTRLAATRLTARSRVTGAGQVQANSADFAQERIAIRRPELACPLALLVGFLESASKERGGDTPCQPLDLLFLLIPRKAGKYMRGVCGETRRDENGNEMVYQIDGQYAEICRNH
jgi:hypothetical protein